ncbi:hypothetical protein CY35_05G081900 [Sphagnum magellanicum]|jgi:hypothetical protein|nr:hypothetical protein CY35_05G081900 [Sphagnum magellanicum]
MDASKDRLVRNITIAATALCAALLLTTDYGPQPHAFTPVQKSIKAAKDWFWTPSKKEQEELERRLPIKQTGISDQK